jgi:hypothetical protein
MVCLGFCTGRGGGGGGEAGSAVDLFCQGDCAAARAKCKKWLGAYEDYAANVG